MVVGIIIFITGLSLPAFSNIFRSQGIAKAARMVQTAIMQARTRAVTLGRQHQVQFRNNYQGTGNTVILVMDGKEDMDGNGDPWTISPTNGWETADAELIASLNVPKGFEWVKGTVAGVANASLPIVVCMPDGTLRMVEEKVAAPFMQTSLPDATSDNFNATPASNHDLSIQRAGGADRFFLNIMKTSGRVKIKGE